MKSIYVESGVVAYYGLGDSKGEFSTGLLRSFGSDLDSLYANATVECFDLWGRQLPDMPMDGLPKSAYKAASRAIEQAYRDHMEQIA